MMMKRSAPYFAITVRLVNVEPTRTPTTLKTPVVRIAPAAMSRTVIACSGDAGAPFFTRQKYSAKVIAIAPSEAARIMTSWLQPNTKAGTFPQPWRRNT